MHTYIHTYRDDARPGDSGAVPGTCACDFLYRGRRITTAQGDGWRLYAPLYPFKGNICILLLFFKKKSVFRKLL